jgi:HTH-type transcriptional regulator, sugar sensing transcriptional regulator
MNTPMLVSNIEDLGLSNKEARVYLACLRIGPSSVQNIADESGIKRVTTYVILESLVGLGLVSQTTKGKKTYFIAEDPINLERLIDRRQQELKEQKQNFNQILPELHGLKLKPKDAPTVKFYDSTDGIKTILNSFLEHAKRPDIDRVYGFSNLDLVLSFFPEFRASMANPWRSKAGIHSQFLYTSSDGPIMKETDEIRNRESRWLPPDRFPIAGDFTIVGSNVLMLSLGATHPTGITIDSEELAQGLRVMFLAAWDAAAAYN